MKIINYSITILLCIFLFTGCVPIQITLDNTVKKDYKPFTSEVYTKMKKCFQNFPIENIFGIYPVKEMHKNPNYSKIILYGKYADNNVDDIIGIITIFEKKNDINRVVITERRTTLQKWYYVDNMECKND